MSIPLYKLGVLTIKTLSKPVARSLQAKARNSESFKNICVNIGNANNKLTYYVKKLNYKQEVKFVPISEKVAIETGTNILGEGVIYGIATGLLIEEYTRNKISKSREEAEMEKRFERIEKQIDDLKDVIIKTK